MGRIACVFVPHFELAVRARGEPGLWEQAVAVIDWAARPPRILGVTPVAERLGVRVGQIASGVRARLPELTCLAPDPVLLAKAEREALSALSTVAPRLDTDGRGTFLLGLEGLERLWSKDASVLARLSAVFAELKLQARFAIASTPFEAWVRAAWAQPRGKIASLDDVPLAELSVGERARELCGLLGLRSAGDLVRLPKGTLAARLGAEGHWLERLCRGESFQLWPTANKLPAITERVELELDLPLEGLEPLLMAFRSLLDRLLGAVGASREALVELGVRVRLDDRREHVERFVPEHPTLQPDLLLELLCLWLERRPFASPVAFLELSAQRVGPATQAQLSLLDQKEERAAAARGKAIARLTAAFGAESVLRPVLHDTYRPEARIRWLPALGAKSALVPAVRGAFAPLTLALRQLVPPEPVAIRPGPALHRAGHAPVRILGIDGPQRLTGEWWGEAFERSYSWLRLATGELCWIFRDERSGRWFLQAVGD